jgi:hypothetical protein
MSITCLGDPESPLLKFLDAAPGECSWCARPLVDPVVFWHLAGANLALHPGCAEALGGTLIFEARRADALIRGKSLIGGIDPRALDAGCGYGSASTKGGRI